MTLEIPRRLVELISAGDCVLFVGAGASRDASGPTGSELATLLGSHFGKADIPTSDLRRFADILTGLPDVDREDVDKRIIESVKALAPSAGHRLVPSFCWRAIFTTNYDRLIEVSYDIAHTEKIHAAQDLQLVVSLVDPYGMHDRGQVPLFKLHGCISNISKGNPLVLTTRDYQSTAKKRRKFLRYLRQLVREHVILFAGYSFADGVILPLLDEIEAESPYRSTRHMFAIDLNVAVSGAEFLRSRNIECISSSFSEFFTTLADQLDANARRACLSRRLEIMQDIKGEKVVLPAALRLSLDNQVEQLTPHGFHETDGKGFLSGLPPENGDLRGGTDIERQETERLTAVVREQLGSKEFLRPAVIVLGVGGAGKSTLACRVAYNLAASGEAAAFRLKAEELWDRNQLIELANRVHGPSIFVVNDIEVSTRYKAVRELRNYLSEARCQTTLLLSCQKAVWNGYQQSNARLDIGEFSMSDCLSRPEARELVLRLVQRGLLAEGSRYELDRLANHVVSECEGHLVVAMLELVRNGKFRDIILFEYENLSDRAKNAYKFVALLHQHSIAIPDYLLNQVTVKDWDVFKREVIRLEADLIIVQDLNSSSGRIMFRTRHPLIAQVVLDAVVPKREDRVRMYRGVVEAIAGTHEDRAFLLQLLTSREVRRDLGHDQHVEELFEIALETFPEDRTLLLHLGKFETQVGNLDRAYDLLTFARSLEPRDTYIIHQLGICLQKRAERESDPVVKDATYQEALKLFELKQLRDPYSHYGYTAEAKLHLSRVRRLLGGGKAELDALSAAAAAIQRGLAIVWPDDRGPLKECEVQMFGTLQDPAKVVKWIESMRTADGRLTYGSTYHLLAVCLMRMGETERALGAIQEGLTHYPGDRRLSGLFLELVEAHLHSPSLRERCKALLSSGRLAVEPDLGVSFVEAVIKYYDDQYSATRYAFESIRERASYRASTRVRVLLRDENGNTVLKHGTVVVAGQRRWIRERDSGLRVAIDDPGALEKLGHPTEVTYELGFAFAGPRAQIIVPEDQNKEEAP